MTNKHDNSEKTSANKVSCWDCEQNATERLKEMFVEMGQKHAIASGAKPARRAVFRKQHGIVYGHFKINADIDPAFKIGIFAGDEYECAVRFSSDTGPTDPDLKSTLGCSLRGVAIFAKACFGHPSPSKRQKLNATANAFGAPIRPRHLVPTQQGVGTLAPNDLTPCRMAFYFVSTFAIAQTPTKQPALRLSRTKNLHFAKAPFPGFSAKAVWRAR